MPISSYRTVDGLLASIVARAVTPVPVRTADQRPPQGSPSAIAATEAAAGVPDGADLPRPDAAPWLAAPQPGSPVPIINDIYMVGPRGRQRPMAFVAKVDNDTGKTVVTLKRLDWKTLGTFARLRAHLLAWFRSEPPRKRHLSDKEVVALRLADAARAPENALMIRLHGFFPGTGHDAHAAEGQGDEPHDAEAAPAFSASALSTWNSPAFNVRAADGADADASGSGVSDPARLRERRLAALEAAKRKPSPQQRADAIVSAFAPVILAQCEHLRQARQPLSVELRMERRMFAQTRARVEAQCDRFALDDEQKAAVLRRLRLNTAVFLHAEGISLDPAAPAASAASGRLARMECWAGDIAPPRSPSVDAGAEATLAAIPLRDPTLASKRDIVLGDLHGDWMLLLQVLVQTGFIESSNDAAWRAMWTQLNAVARSGHAMSDHDWRAFLRHFTAAATLQDGARTGRVVTFAGNLVGPAESANRMLDILHQLTRLGLKFDCLMGNEECDLLQQIVDRPAASPARDSLADSFIHWLIPRLKLLSCSRDGTALYAHSFANREALAPLCHALNVPLTGTLETDVAKLNLRFNAVVSSIANTRADPGPDMAAFNGRTLALIRHAVASEPFDLARLKNAAPTLPHSAAQYVVHAGRINVWSEVASLHHRVEALEADMAALTAIFASPASRRWMSEALEPLTAIMGRLDGSSCPEEIRAAGNLLALAMCHEPRLFDHKEASVLQKLVFERGEEPGRRAQALEAVARIWNDGYPADSTATRFDIGKLTESQRHLLFETLSARWRAVLDKEAFLEDLDVLAAQTVAPTEQLRGTIRALTPPDTRHPSRVAAPDSRGPATVAQREAGMKAPRRNHVPALSSMELRNYLAPLSARFHSLHNPGRKAGAKTILLTIHAID